MKVQYINPSRRDLLAQIAGAGAGVAVLSSAGCSRAQTPATLTLEQDPVWKDGPDYEALRRAMLAKANVPARYPDVIVTAGDEAEIMQALAFARANDLKVVCRTSGHNTAGAVMRDGGMLLDISPMDAVTFDPQTNLVTAQPAALLGYFMAVVKDAGFDFPHGDCDSVALCGYLLGGGLGKNGKHYTGGPACYAIERAEIITADGQKLVADREQNPELLWAIKGAGPGFFGVITNLTLRVFDKTAAKLTSRFTFPADALPEIFDRLSTLGELDSLVETGVSLTRDRTNPDQALARVSISAYAMEGADPVGQARALINAHTPEGLSEAALSVDGYIETDLDQPLFNYPPGFNTQTDNAYVDDPSVFAQFVDWFMRAPAGSITSLGLSYQSLAASHRADACYSSGGRHMISYHFNWLEDRVEDMATFLPAAQSWMGEFDGLVRPHAKGHFISQVDNERYPDRIENAFTPDNWSRLMALKDVYDPQGRFYSYLGL